MALRRWVFNAIRERRAKGVTSGSVGRVSATDEEQRNREIDEAYRRIQLGETDDDGLWD